MITAMLLPGVIAYGFSGYVSVTVADWKSGRADRIFFSGMIAGSAVFLCLQVAAIIVVNCR